MNYYRFLSSEGLRTFIQTWHYFEKTETFYKGLHNQEWDILNCSIKAFMGTCLIDWLQR